MVSKWQQNKGKQQLKTIAEWKKKWVDQECKKCIYSSCDFNAPIKDSNNNQINRTYIDADNRQITIPV